MDLPVAKVYSTGSEVFLVPKGKKITCVSEHFLCLLAA